MLHFLRKILIASFVIALFTILLSGCKDSNPTSQEAKAPTPDTLNYSAIAGAWEGAGRYGNPEDDPYESDSLFITHFEITKKKAVGTDSIGFMKWNNKNEYCYGPLDSNSAGDSTYRVTVLPQSSSTCVGGSSVVIFLTHKETADEEWISWYGGQVKHGTLHRK